MRTLYALTDRNRQAFPGNRAPWSPGVVDRASQLEWRWFEPWFSCYPTRLLASMAAEWRVRRDDRPKRYVDKDILWEVEGAVQYEDTWSSRCSEVKVIREVPLVGVTHQQCVHFGVLAALAVNDGPGYRAFASAWFSGRSAVTKADWIINAWREGGRYEWAAAWCAAYGAKHLVTAAERQATNRPGQQIQCEEHARSFAANAAEAASLAAIAEGRQVDFTALAQEAMEAAE